MKRKRLFGAALLSVFMGATALYGWHRNAAKPVHSLMQENIDALASGESGDEDDCVPVKGLCSNTTITPDALSFH